MAAHVKRNLAHNGRQKPLVQYSEMIGELNVSILPAVVLSAVTWYLLQYVVQPLFGPNEYYIDEEFHVPQARLYCQAVFDKVRIFFFSYVYNGFNVHINLVITHILSRIGFFGSTTT